MEPIPNVHFSYGITEKERRRKKHTLWTLYAQRNVYSYKNIEFFSMANVSYWLPKRKSNQLFFYRGTFFMMFMLLRQSLKGYPHQQYTPCNILYKMYIFILLGARNFYKAICAYDVHTYTATIYVFICSIKVFLYTRMDRKFEFFTRFSVKIFKSCNFFFVLFKIVYCFLKRRVLYHTVSVR